MEETMKQTLDNQRERNQETGPPETRTRRQDQKYWRIPILTAELGQVGTTKLWGGRDGGKVKQSWLYPIHRKHEGIRGTTYHMSLPE